MCLINKNLFLGLSFLLYFFSITYNLKVFAQNITFKIQNNIVKEISIADLKKNLKISSMEVIEPHENKKIVYSGFKIKEVLNYIYGKNWKKNELVLFICADGYKDPISAEKIFIENPLLAIEKKGSSDFSVNNQLQNQKNIPLAPMYLVWNNINNSQLLAEGSNGWPYQVVSLELTNFAEKFPHMIPLNNSNDKISRGFKGFQSYCMTCHKINGDGGDKGPELTSFPIKYEQLDKWIDNPTSLKANTTMPPLNLKVKNRKQLITDIIEYLKFMNSKNIK